MVRFASIGRSILALACVLFAAALFVGCVNQHPDESAASGGSNGGAAGETASGTRIVATSAAIAQLCDRLEIDLVGVPESSDVPERYADATTVGTAMSPDLEILKSLSPDCVLSPNTLMDDLQPKYAAIGVASAFLDLSSVEGLYDSIEWLGRTFDREEQARALAAEHEAFMTGYRAEIAGREAPSVLILMGVPGSYIVATENSYVGSLVELAGGQNVYAGTDQEFLNANTEDMQVKDPDIILRASHGLPDEVTEMFAEEFAQNDIWRHFTAVQEGRVYDLPYDEFGMSANLDYADALEYLLPLLYGEG